MPANLSIDKVTLEYEGDELVATMVGEALQTGLYAFDLYRNGKRIHTQGYSQNVTLRVGVTRTEPGLYRVLGFFLAPNGKRSFQYSNPLFRYPGSHAQGYAIKNVSSKDTATSRADYSIQKVILEQQRDELVATVVGEVLQAGQYAFDLYRNGERIHAQEYSATPTLRVGIKAEPGLYRVLAQCRGLDGNTITKNSNPLFLNPVLYTLEDSSGRLQPEDRALLLQGQYWKYPALYYAGKEQQRLFVMLSAAIDRSKHRLPVFNRWTWAEMNKFPGHVLCIADPTLELHDEMNLGWYLGTDEHDVSEELSKFIRRVAEALSIPEDKIVIWGSSGGGFAALAVTSHIEKATAVAINPQTDVFDYEIARYVETVRRCCFRNQTTQHIQERFGPRVNMAQAWRRNRSSRVILIQNKLDSLHYACHFKPFWEALGGTAEGKASPDGRHYAWLYNDPRGHVAESEQMVPDILNLIDQGRFTASTVMPVVPASNK